MCRREMKTGDVVVTDQAGVYMISEIYLDDHRMDKIYLATTLDTEGDYIGTLCYYNKEHRTIGSLLLAIQEEEGIAYTVRREDIQKKLFDI